MKRDGTRTSLWQDGMPEYKERSFSEFDKVFEGSSPLLSSESLLCVGKETTPFEMVDCWVTLLANLLKNHFGAIK